MILTLVILILLIIISAISIHKEPRLLRNAIFLLLTMVILFYFIAEIAYYYDLTDLNYAVMIIAYGLIPLIMVLFCLFLLYSGICMIKKEGVKLISFLPIALGLFGILFPIFTFYMVFGTEGRFLISYPPLIRNIITILFTFISLVVIYLVFEYIALFIYSALYCKLPKAKDYDYVIVLGCGLLHGEDVSPLLAGRLKKGIETYKKSSKSAKIIVSGGKGSDESLSEAAAMKKWLLANDIPESDIIVEDQSTTTYENLKFSKKIIESFGTPYKCVFVTNEYHVFRAGTFAKKLNFPCQGIGCKTAIYYWASAFTREYIALIVQHKKLFMVYCAAVLVFCAITLIM